MGVVWTTKFGRRRVRHEPPTLEEALAAADCMTSDPYQRIELAASLIGLPIEDVKAAAAKFPPTSSATSVRQIVRRGSTTSAVTVEHRKTRRSALRRPVERS